MGWVLQTTHESGVYNVAYGSAGSEGYWYYTKAGKLVDHPDAQTWSGSFRIKFTVKGAWSATLQVTGDGSFDVWVGAAHVYQVVTRTTTTGICGDFLVGSNDDVSLPETVYIFYGYIWLENCYGPGYVNVNVLFSGHQEIWVWEDDEDDNSSDSDEDSDSVVSRPVVTPTKTVEKTVTTSADGTTIDTVTVTTERTVVLGGIYYNEVPITSVWKTDNITNVTNCNGDTATETTTVTTVTERTETSDGNVTTTSSTSTEKTLTEVEADYIL